MEKPGLSPERNASLLVGLERRGAAGNVLEWDPRHAYACRLRRRTSDMNRKCLLEISVETLEGALAAERGSADRIELCADLSLGGVTPAADLPCAVRAPVLIPIFSTVR